MPVCSGWGGSSHSLHGAGTTPRLWTSATVMQIFPSSLFFLSFAFFKLLEMTPSALLREQGLCPKPLQAKDTWAVSNAQGLGEIRWGNCISAGSTRAGGCDQAPALQSKSSCGKCLHISNSSSTWIWTGPTYPPHLPTSGSNPRDAPLFLTLLPMSLERETPKINQENPLPSHTNASLCWNQDSRTGLRSRSPPPPPNPCAAPHPPSHWTGMGRGGRWCSGPEKGLCWSFPSTLFKLVHHKRCRAEGWICQRQLDLSTSPCELHCGLCPHFPGAGEPGMVQNQQPRPQSLSYYI